MVVGEGLGWEGGGGGKMGKRRSDGEVALLGLVRFL